MQIVVTAPTLSRTPTPPPVPPAQEPAQLPVAQTTDHAAVMRRADALTNVMSQYMDTQLKKKESGVVIPCEDAQERATVHELSCLVKSLKTLSDDSRARFIHRALGIIFELKQEERRNALPIQQHDLFLAPQPVVTQALQTLPPLQTRPMPQPPSVQRVQQPATPISLSNLPNTPTSSAVASIILDLQKEDKQTDIQRWLKSGKKGASLQGEEGETSRAAGCSHTAQKSIITDEGEVIDLNMEFDEGGTGAGVGVGDTSGKRMFETISDAEDDNQAV